MLKNIKRERHNSGFTITELIIVIVIISILATLTIVTYNGIQNSARRSTTINEIDSIAKQLEINKYQNNERYAAGTTGLKYSSNFILQYTYTPGTNSYCITLSGTNIEMYKTNTSEAQDGICPGHISQLVAALPAVHEDWTLLETGGDTTCGLYLTVPYCWGANDWGQFGSGVAGSSVLPSSVLTSGVLSGKTITQYSAGVYQTCVLTSDAKSFCSGMGARGQLGNSSVANSSIMVAPTLTGVLSGKTITKISAGQQHVCAIASGVAYCWGFAGDGELGNNSITNATSPVAVTATGVLSGKTMTSISGGYFNTCAIDNTGKAYCWGLGPEGQLGDGTTPASSLVPVAVTTTGVLAGKTLTKVQAGLRNACGQSSDNLIFCWGMNTSGQFGNSLNTNTSVPIQVPMNGVLSGKTISDFSMGGSHMCVLTTEGKIYCTGGNTYGQLGNNSTTSSLIFVAVDTSTALSGKTVTAISHGVYSNHTCAMTSEGQIFCWGSGSRGQLGNNTTTNSPVPTLTTHP